MGDDRDTKQPSCPDNDFVDLSEADTRSGSFADYPDDVSDRPEVIIVQPPVSDSDGK